jgi:hypothetical protein
MVIIRIIDSQRNSKNESISCALSTVFLNAEVPKRLNPDKNPVSGGFIQLLTISQDDIASTQIVTSPKAIIEKKSLLLNVRK